MSSTGGVGGGPIGQASASARSVVVDREFPHPAEKVWRALTTSHLMEEWLMKNDFQAVVGHRFNLRRTPKPDFDVVVDCQVLEVEPQKSLSYAYTAFDLEGVVTWTLTPTREGTRLRVEQSGFRPDQKRAAGGALWGWTQAVDKLVEILSRSD